VHQAALDRRDYFDGTPRPDDRWPEKRYAPPNVAAFLAGVGAERPVAQTTRVARGTPCGDEHGAKPAR
jgi:hypothetical protein